MTTKQTIVQLLVAACGGATDDAAPDGGGLDLPPAKKAKKVVVGTGTTYVLTTDGELRAFGWNENLGFGDDDNTLVPRTLIASGVVDVSTRYLTTCVVLGDGTAKCWGDNRSGTIGDGTTTNRATPTPVTGIAGATSIAVGDDAACAVLATGVKCWGSNEARTLNAMTPDPNNTNSWVPSLTPIDVTGLGGTAKRVSMGSRHGCAIMANDKLKCWGQNTWGQLGTGNNDGLSQPQTFGTTVADVAGLSGVIDVTAFDTHTVAVLSTGAVKSWGKRENGNLGDGNDSAFDNSYAPVDVVGVQSGATAASGWCAVASGKVYCWNHYRGGGRDEEPLYSATPTLVPGISNAAQVSNDGTHTCVVRTTGGLTCWGENTNGQLGIGIDGPSDTFDIQTPQDVPSFE
jgi:alpha-tubulin suppressor-like RCC1 family protein